MMIRKVPIRITPLLLLLFMVAFGCQKEAEFTDSGDQAVAVARQTGGGATEAAPYFPVDCWDPNIIDLFRVCFAVYDPVCACGTITFPNACEASRFGFTNTTRGPCNLPDCRSQAVADFWSEHFVCLAVYDPVCGCDGQTYSNSCYALANGVVVWTKGACGSLVQVTH